MEDEQNNSKCKTTIQFKMEEDQNGFKMEEKIIKMENKTIKLNTTK